MGRSVKVDYCVIPEQIMEKVYKDKNDEWRMSEGSRVYSVQGDGHTYFTEVVDIDGQQTTVVGHDNCPCLNKK